MLTLWWEDHYLTTSSLLLRHSTCVSCFHDKDEIMISGSPHALLQVEWIFEFVLDLDPFQP